MTTVRLKSCACTTSSPSGTAAGSCGNANQNSAVALRRVLLELCAFERGIEVKRTRRHWMLGPVDCRWSMFRSSARQARVLATALHARQMELPPLQPSHPRSHPPCPRSQFLPLPLLPFPTWSCVRVLFNRRGTLHLSASLPRKPSPIMRRALSVAIIAPLVPRTAHSYKQAHRFLERGVIRPSPCTPLPYF